MRGEILRSPSIKQFIFSFLLPIVLAISACNSGSRGVPVVQRDSQGNPAAQETASSQNVQLGAFQELADSDYLMAPIATPRGRGELSGSYEEKRIDFARNYLFVNLTDKSSHLLLQTNDYLILEAKVLPFAQAAKDAKVTPSEPPRDENKTGSKWIYYRVVKADTDNDKQLTINDRWTVAFSEISGDDYQELLEDVEAILFEKQRGEHLILIFKSGGKNHIAEIHLPTRQVTITRDLQEIQPK
ncbi:MAG: hypothetical protein AB1757_08160 [Acidobacteriota bacterium]